MWRPSFRGRFSANLTRLRVFFVTISVSCSSCAFDGVAPRGSSTSSSVVAAAVFEAGEDAL
eukprot:557468-Prymnesium_polylepis.1